MVSVESAQYSHLEKVILRTNLSVRRDYFEMIIITSCTRHVGNVCFYHVAKFKMAETDTVRESITVLPVKYSMSGSQGEERNGSEVKR